MKTANEATILCVRSNRWASLLLQNFPDDSNLRWALDIHEMMFEANSCFDAVCILELDSNSNQFIDQCEQLIQFSNNPSKARLFVVGDHGLVDWNVVFQQLNVQMVCHSALEVGSLIQKVRLCHAHSGAEPISIEIWAESNLPWSIPNQF